MTIKRVCAGCKKIIGEVEGDFAGGGVTHGICMRCLGKLYPDHYKEIRNEEALRRGRKISGNRIGKILATPLR